MATNTTGSRADFVRRMRAVLPLGWFPSPPATGEAETAPTLVGVLAGPATMFAAIWQLLGYLLAQTRISTSTGPFIDMVALDFFGAGSLVRNLGESDDAYRGRVLAALFPARSTRAAVSDAIFRLTGNTPLVIEPRRAADTKGCGTRGDPTAGGGYGTNGGGMYYGSRIAPYQSWVEVDNRAAQIPAATIYQTTALNLPESYIAWVQISS